MCLIHLKKHLIISNHNFTIILKEHFMFLIQNQIIITNYNYFLNIPMTGSINVVFFYFWYLFRQQTTVRLVRACYRTALKLQT